MGASHRGQPLSNYNIFCGATHKKRVRGVGLDLCVCVCEV